MCRRRASRRFPILATEDDEARCDVLVDRLCRAIVLDRRQVPVRSEDSSGYALDTTTRPVMP
jgi:hypothetical protein